MVSPCNNRGGRANTGIHTPPLFLVPDHSTLSMVHGAGQTPTSRAGPNNEPAGPIYRKIHQPRECNSKARAYIVVAPAGMADK